jgi:hypothetical protein
MDSITPYAPLINPSWMPAQSPEISALILATLPLVTRKGGDLKRGRVESDAAPALMPICHDYTVASSVAVLFAIKVAEPNVTDDRTGFALYLATQALLAFACRGRASSAACVAARAYLLDNWTKDTAGIAADDQCALERSMTDDADALARGRFGGECFGTRLEHVA